MITIRTGITDKELFGDMEPEEFAKLDWVGCREIYLETLEMYLRDEFPEYNLLIAENQKDSVECDDPKTKQKIEKKLKKIKEKIWLKKDWVVRR